MKLRLDKEEIVELLYDNGIKEAYHKLLELEEISNISDELYKYFDIYSNMLSDKKMHIRVRGFRLIAKNAKWDKENKINNIIHKLLLELDDEKPTSVRQCIEALEEIIPYKPELIPDIKEELLGINYLKYKDTMQPLIFKDIEEILNLMKKYECTCTDKCSSGYNPNCTCISPECHCRESQK